MERVGGGVKADVENGLAVIDHLTDLFLVSDLGDEAAGLQFFVDLHGKILLRFCRFFHFFTEAIHKNTLRPVGTEGEIIAVPPLVRRRLRRRGLVECQHTPAR